MGSLNLLSTFSNILLLFSLSFKICLVVTLVAFLLLLFLPGAIVFRPRVCSSEWRLKFKKLNDILVHFV